MKAAIDFSEFRQGWPTLFAAVLGNATGVGAIMYYSLSSFMLPLEDEFGWTRADIGGAVSCLVLGWIISMPSVGALCDRIGPRGPVLVSIPFLVAVLVGLSFLDGALWQLYLLFFLGAVLGSGTLAVSYIATVTRSFRRNRGLAYGIALAGAGISALMLPIGLHGVIDGFGWRAAWLALAAVSLLQWPVAYLCIAGVDGSVMRPGIESRSTCTGLTLRESLKSREFWLLALAFLFIALALSGLLINLIPLLVETGLTIENAAKASAGIGGGLIFARLFIGYLLDRVQARYVAVFAFLVGAMGCFQFSTADSHAAALGAVALGFTVGSEMDLLAYMTHRYFGERAHSSVYALSLSIFYLGAVLAPLLVGIMHSWGGSYVPVLYSAIGACVMAIVLVLFMGPYPIFGSVGPTATETTS